MQCVIYFHKQVIFPLPFRLTAVLKDHVIMMDQDTQWLYQLLAEVQLERFYLRVRDGLNVTRIEHLDYVKESDLEQIGISKPGLYPVLIWNLSVALLCYLSGSTCAA